MSKLTDPQIILLRSAAGADHGSVPTPQEPKGKATATRLVRMGLMISIPIDGFPSRLLITEAGKVALHGEDPGTAPPTRPTLGLAVGEPTVPVVKGKLGIIIELLTREEGATLDVLKEATGWQGHSVRGALAGAVKKTAGTPVISERMGQQRIYRLPSVVA